METPERRRDGENTGAQPGPLLALLLAGRALGGPAGPPPRLVSDPQGQWQHPDRRVISPVPCLGAHSVRCGTRAHSARGPGQVPRYDYAPAAPWRPEWYTCSTSVFNMLYVEQAASAPHAVRWLGLWLQMQGSVHCGRAHAAQAQHTHHCGMHCPARLPWSPRRTPLAWSRYTQ